MALLPRIVAESEKRSLMWKSLRKCPLSKNRTGSPVGNRI